MLHSREFEVNEAWILFRLNTAPIQTERDGDFDCLALMDAGSCFIFGTELVALDAIELSPLQTRRLFKRAKMHKQESPKMLYIPKNLVADSFSQEATRQGIHVNRVLESNLLSYISEAKAGFRQYQEGRLE
jgi:hypothetical protein